MVYGLQQNTVLEITVACSSPSSLWIYFVLICLFDALLAE